MSRLRVSDRASGEIVHETGSEEVADGSSTAVVSAMVSRIGPAAVRGRVAYEVVIDGWRFEFDVEDAHRAELRARATTSRADGVHDGPTEVRAIIPGRVVSLAVEIGSTVEPGQRLLVVEAMKMENELRAPRAGLVERLTVGPGETVELGDLLVVLR